jgi:hypothetical protein
MRNNFFKLILLSYFYLQNCHFHLLHIQIHQSCYSVKRGVQSQNLRDKISNLHLFSFSLKRRTDSYKVIIKTSLNPIIGNSFYTILTASPPLVVPSTYTDIMGLTLLIFFNGVHYYLPFSPKG